MTNNITFKKAVASDKPLIKEWWNKPHVMEFWDNSPEMWQNVENYLDKGIIDLFDYWIGYKSDVPFSLVMSSFIDPTQKDIYGRNCIQDGDSWSMDFMIGCDKHLRQGLAAPTLKAFMDFAPAKVKRFLIDPASHNKRAVHVYTQAGFKEVERFTPETGSFAGQEHIMMRCNK
ncbi:MAG: GNAT family N-acetyltransferase [Proteobacteria bacterium]|nr:GNAT family N-acetyltransferase [Pseudomonadota bacterium]